MEREAKLLEIANAARGNAVAPYSGLSVGAALEAENGEIVSGANIENATYGLTMCAERVAMLKALSDGHRAFSRILIASDATGGIMPCGACRQILWEFGGNLEVLIANRDRVVRRAQMAELLPAPFDQRNLP